MDWLILRTFLPCIQNIKSSSSILCKFFSHKKFTTNFSRNCEDWRKITCDTPEILIGLGNISYLRIKSFLFSVNNNLPIEGLPNVLEEKEPPIVHFYAFETSTIVFISSQNEFFRKNFPLVQCQIEAKKGPRLKFSENNKNKS